ncbi:MAG: hypothetical protein ACYC6Y_14255 [Thermoguttaceae bacterium]
MPALFKPSRVGWVVVVAVGWCGAGVVGRGQEPPALNPFGPVQTERDDAVPGYLEMSDGRVLVGNVYMTRDKRLKLYDESTRRQREIPLRAVKQIDCKVLKEWMEKEWKFKELALDEKYYTGKEYPSRECEYTITLQDGRTITGPLAELFYVQPFSASPDEARSYRPEIQAEKFLVHKRQKGEAGTVLKDLIYVKRIKLGPDAVEEGKQKAGSYRPGRQAPATPSR